MTFLVSNGAVLRVVSEGEECKCEVTSCSGSSSAAVDGHLMQLCLTSVKFARKKGNIALAWRLLRTCADRAPPAGGPEELHAALQQLSLDTTLQERWGPELEIEKAKVLRTAGQRSRPGRGTRVRV